jgi:hypothetical protein
MDIIPGLAISRIIEYDFAHTLFKFFYIEVVVPLHDICDPGRTEAAVDAIMTACSPIP